MKKGTLIVFEGGEGSGKTHHSRLLYERLKRDGKRVMRTHEPGATALGKKIRHLILEDEETAMTARAELLLFLADRAQHVEEMITPAVQEGSIVICDRFSGSTFAYQLGGRQLTDGKTVELMDAYARQDLCPDIVVYLDVDPKTGIKRKQDGDDLFNRMDAEALEFHQRVRTYFLNLAQKEQWLVISTESGSKEDNAEKIYQAIQSRLEL
jgi:dTMP kinase